MPAALAPPHVLRSTKQAQQPPSSPTGPSPPFLATVMPDAFRKAPVPQPVATLRGGGNKEQRPPNKEHRPPNHSKKGGPTVEQLLKESKTVYTLPSDGNTLIRLMVVDDADLLKLLESKRRLRAKAVPGGGGPGPWPLGGGLSCFPSAATREARVC